MVFDVSPLLILNREKYSFTIIQKKTGTNSRQEMTRISRIKIMALSKCSVFDFTIDNPGSYMFGFSNTLTFNIINYFLYSGKIQIMTYLPNCRGKLRYYILLVVSHENFKHHFSGLLMRAHPVGRSSCHSVFDELCKHNYDVESVPQSFKPNVWWLSQEF